MSLEGLSVRRDPQLRTIHLGVGAYTLLIISCLRILSTALIGVIYEGRSTEGHRAYNSIHVRFWIRTI